MLKPPKAERKNPTKYYQLFGNFFDHRLLRGFWPDRHRKPRKLRGLRLLQTGGAENTGPYGVF